MADEPVVIVMDENWAKDVTPTLFVGTPASGYTAAKLSNGNAADPLRLTGNVITARYDLGSAKNVTWAALIGHNFDAGLANVTIKIGNDGSYATFEETGTFVIPARDAAGFSVDPHVDLTAGSPSPPACRYVQFSATTANSITLQIGDIWFGSHRVLPVPILMRSPKFGLGFRTVVHETTKGTLLTYGRGIERNTFVGTIAGSRTDLETVRGLFEISQGMLKRCLWITQPSINVARLFHWADVFEMPQIQGQAYSAQLTFIESSRGIKPPTT